MAPFDPLEALRQSGHPVDLLSDRQRAVFESLTESEVTVLNSIKARLDAAAPEVEGHDLKIV